jgi:4-hydroxybenzoate polyprenyltransferase
MSESAHRRGHPWMQLLRLPNLLTVPGDALAGGVLAAAAWPGAAVWGAVGAMLLVYAGGLVLNDCCDVPQDAAERPERPLPSGRVSLRTALTVALALLAAGLALALVVCGPEACLLALGVVFFVVIYDTGGKGIPVLGPLLMGACRGGSVLVGAVAAGDLTAGLPAAVLALLYTASVTFLAKDEATDRRPGMLRAILPGLVLAVGAIAARCILPIDVGAARLASAGVWLLTLAGGPGLLLLLWSAGEAVLIGHGVATGERPVPPSIGRLVRIMITIQAAWLVWFLPPEGLAAPLVLVAMLILRFCAGRLGRRISGS